MKRLAIDRSTTVELTLVGTLIAAAFSFGIVYSKVINMDRKLTAVYCFLFDDPTCDPNAKKLHERTAAK